MGNRARRLAAVAAVFVAGAGLGGMSLGTLPAARAQTPAPGLAGLKGMANGSAIHADVADIDPTTRVVNVDVAAAGAGVNTTDAGTPYINEFDRSGLGYADDDATTPVANSFASHAAGLAADVGLGNPPPTPGTLELVAPTRAENPATTGGPGVGPNEELIDVPVDPIVTAQALESSSVANFNGVDCLVGDDLSRGRGYAAGAQVLPAPDPAPPLLATDSSDPDNPDAVTQTLSRTRLVARTDASNNVIGPDLGLLSEVRQILAPVQLPDGTVIQITGTWVLQAVANGSNSYIHYGPGEATPSTPVVRIIPPGVIDPNDITEVLLQDILGDTGLQIDVPGVATITIGEAPRAIGGAYGSAPVTGGLTAAAAVDVVRIDLLPGTPLESTIAIGHMEVSATAPAGGVSCPDLLLTKSVDRTPVRRGEEFLYTIGIRNPSGCNLTNVTATDIIEATPGVTWAVTGATPAATTVTQNRVVWSTLPDLPLNGTQNLTITIRVGADSRGGRFTDTATASGRCTVDTANGVQVQLDVTGGTVVDIPEVLVEIPRDLPRTGGELLPAGIGAAILGGVLALRRRFS